eukprot:TRINITY_DN13418_c0_g1_i1.p1 TRINITY_DN13418_c0_g1~~TRINITY_DN13418_c0_g1_i1.p1  ORF type:complete len:216 (+),score=65.26 TRINITY_DN13418_c0_g1_i1:77-649(+)
MPAERRVLRVKDATPENFAKYGTLLRATESGLGSSNYQATRVCNPATNFKCDDDDGAMLVLEYNPRPLEVRYLERHYKHTQAFIPLNGKPLVGVFAPPTAGPEPRLSECEALRFDGTAGFVMHKGVWHEQPFPLLPLTQAVCFLRNETVRELRLGRDNRNGECHGHDIDKLNIEERFGVVFDIDPFAPKL